MLDISYLKKNITNLTINIIKDDTNHVNVSSYILPAIILKETEYFYFEILKKIQSRKKRYNMKIFWTFDPFQKNDDLNKFGRKIIHSLFDKNDNLNAVYVASNAEVELSTAFNIPEEKRYSLYPKELILKKLKKLKMDQLNVDVLPSRKISLSSNIEALVKHSQEKKADMIVIATNSKALLPRLVLGSFCESLIHSSTCDLLIYHQKTNFKSPKNILYAHDFSKKGDIGLERVITYAKKWNAQITIVHAPMYEADTTYEIFKKNTQKHAAEIEKMVIGNKIVCKTIINYDIKPIHKIVLAAATKSKADIVVMSAQVGKFTAFLGGSVSRQVLREAKIPSLILKV